MTLNFQCPFCHTSLQGEGTEAKIEVQCPQCHQRFAVDTGIHRLPEVRAVPAGPPPLSPREQQRREKKARDEADRMKLTYLVGGSMAAFAIIFFAGQQISKKSVEKKTSSPGKAEFTIPKVPDEDTIKINPEDVRREQERIAKAEQLKEERLNLQEQKLVEVIRESFCSGNQRAAEALARELRAAAEEVWKTHSDGIPDNEPKPGTEFELMEKRLLERIRASKLISDALSGPPEQIARILVNPAAASRQLAGMSGIPPVLEGKRGFGTGFWITADGWLVTNEHVVASSKTVELHLGDQKVIPARVVRTDEVNDLAILKADNTVPAAWLPVSRSEKEMTLGTMVFTIGFPDPIQQGLEPKYTDGKISSQSGLNDDKRFYQTSIPVQPGNSGGAMIDYSTGWVVGVMSMRLDRGSSGRITQSVSYALKGDQLYPFVQATPDAVASLRKQQIPEIRKGDATAITERAIKASVLIIVPR
jgi:S1-C subfamily serine protease